MPANVEIKARVADLERIRRRVEPRSDAPVEVLRQEDTFYRAPEGRLKLRVLGPGRGELIQYHRPDRAGPKPSVYTVAPTADPGALGRILGSVLAVVGVVRKERLLFRLGQTRVHLDRVEGLGDFLELEVVLEEGQGVEAGVAIAERILSELGVAREDLVEGAYLDLLRDREAPRPADA